MCSLLANSYGSVAGVGALVPKWSGASQDFASPVTRPTLAQVESWIDQVSGILNSILSKEGFAIPVTQADVKLALAMFINEEVASITNGINGSGRFGPTVKERGNRRGRFALILDDVKAFVHDQAIGFENMGATRSKSILSQVAYRDTDEAGNATFPITQRTGFGNSFTDWDPA